MKKKVSGDFGDQRDGPALGFHIHGKFQPFPENKSPIHPTWTLLCTFPWASGLFSAPGELHDKEQ